jgi:hypothetical protein
VPTAIPRPVRISIPYLLDVVFISSAEQIREVERSGAVERLHAFPTSSLPGWVRFYFPATRFHESGRDQWFCPMEPKSSPDYVRRRDYLISKAKLGYTRDDVSRVADLLGDGASDETLAAAMVNIVNARFFGSEIPTHVSTVARRTLQNLPEAVLPWKYVRGRRAQQQVVEYCEGRLPDGVHTVDIAHNIGEVAKTTSRAIRILERNLDTPVEQLFTANPLTPQVPRIATVSSTLGGILRRPAKAGRTIIIYKLGSAAAATGDLQFTFGAGGPDRMCVFTEFFLNFMRDLQLALRAGGRTA